MKIPEKSPKGALIALTAALLLFIDAELAHGAGAPFRAPSAPDGELRKFDVRRVGGKPYGVRSWVRPEEEMTAYSIKTTWKPAARGRELVILRDETRVKGQHSIWSFGFSVIENHMTSQWYSNKVVSPEGNLLRSEKALMYIPKRKTEDKKAKKKADDDIFIVHPNVMSEVMRAHRFEEGSRVYFRMWIPDTYEGMKMILTVKSMESVQVPAGTYRAWRVTMRLDAEEILGRFKGLEFLVKQLLPEYTLWYADMPSHPLVRFEGQFGPRSTAPLQIQEMTSMEH